MRFIYGLPGGLTPHKFNSDYYCVAKYDNGKERGLTRVGTKGQRGLETPSAEVGRGSLKDERHRQGDKHDPLSSGFSWEFVVVRLRFFCILF